MNFKYKYWKIKKSCHIKKYYPPIYFHFISYIAAVIRQLLQANISPKLNSQNSNLSNLEKIYFHVVIL